MSDLGSKMYAENVGGNGGGGSSSTSYSYEEQVVGKWVDGRDIYQKTFHNPNGFGEGDKKIPNSDSINLNTAMLINIWGVALAHGWGGNSRDIPLNTYPNGTWSFSGYLGGDGVYMVASQTSNAETYITIQYVKN